MSSLAKRGRPRVDVAALKVPLGPSGCSLESKSFINRAILFPPPAASAAKLSEVSEAHVFNDDSELTTELVPFLLNHILKSVQSKYRTNLILIKLQ